MSMKWMRCPSHNPQHATSEKPSESPTTRPRPQEWQFNKVTNNISQPLRFHESKTSARRFHTTKRKKRWTEECFDEIDWEHLELALKNKPEGYKVWRSKQNSGFCGTRVQVGRYGGEHQPDEKCPNCGQREIAEHLMLCPNQDRGSGVSFRGYT